MWGREGERETALRLRRTVACARGKRFIDKWWWWWGRLSWYRKNSLSLSLSEFKKKNMYKYDDSNSENTHTKNHTRFRFQTPGHTHG